MVMSNFFKNNTRMIQFVLQIKEKKTRYNLLTIMIRGMIKI